MNRYISTWRAKILWAALLLVPVLALAQSPYEGIYIGTYLGTSDDGEFALIVNDRGYGTLAAYDAVDDIGFVEHNIRVRADGTFQFVTQAGAYISGQATATDVSGSYTAAGTEGSFAGQRAAEDGPLQDAAGYYSGPVSITGTGFGSVVDNNSHMVAIIAGDGTAFFLLDRISPRFAGFWPGFFGSGFDFDLDVGFGHVDFDFGFNPPANTGSGHCGPFNFGFDYSIRVSFLGSVDYDFSFNRPTCGAFWQRNHFPAPVEYSGGIVQIEPDGYIDGMLLDGLVLQGYLDAEIARAEGTLSHLQNGAVWPRHWVIERSSSFNAAQQYNRLSDVDGDGQTDILWRHEVTGENAVWLMDDADIYAELSLEIQRDSQWALVAVSELNDDQLPDLIWRHAMSGDIFVWLSGDAAPVHFELDPSWQIVGSGDFNADARPEVLVRNSGTGANAVIMDLPGQAVLAPFPAMEDPSWSPIAVADFDGDSDPDVLWANQHTTDLLIWLMNGHTLAQELYASTERFSQPGLAGVGDFDGDGTTDILWRDYATGATIVTLRPGEHGAEDIQLGTNVGRDWQVAAVGDLDSDGTDDLIWRHRVTGENTAWFVADIQVTGTTSLMPVPDLHWTIRP